MGLLSKSDDDLIEQLQKWHKESKDKHKDWRAEAEENYEFYAGRQWSDDEEAEFEEDLRQPITFNRIGPLVDAVGGHQINNRQEARYLPRQLGDTQVNEVLTGAAQWVDDEAGTEEEDEDLFHDLCVTGMAWSECRMAYDEDPDGQLLPGERFSPLEAGWDPTSKRRNLADSKFRYRGRWIDRDEVESRWPGIGDTLYLENGQYSWQDDDGPNQPHNQAKAHFYENDQSDWYNEEKDQLFVIHFQWWEHVPVYRLQLPSKLVTLTNEQYAEKKEIIDAMGLKTLRQVKRKYCKAFVTGPVVLEKGVNSWPEGFTLMCATGKRDTKDGVWFGIVRALKDPQRWSNKFLSDLQDMVVSNRQGGAYAEVGALADPRAAEENWNGSGLILLNDGALSHGKIQDRNPPPLPPALDRMIEWCISAIPSVSGINQEFMGYADRDQANVLEMTRKRAAINVLASMFSSLRKYRKDRARAVLHFIRAYMNDGRLIRVLGGDGLEKFIPLALDPQVEDYDVIIDEAASSTNQKDETFGVLMALAPHLQASGIPVPPETLDYTPLRS